MGVHEICVVQIVVWKIRANAAGKVFVGFDQKFFFKTIFNKKSHVRMSSCGFEICPLLLSRTPEVPRKSLHLRLLRAKFNHENVLENQQPSGARFRHCLQQWCQMLCVWSLYLVHLVLDCSVNKAYFAQHETSQKSRQFKEIAWILLLLESIAFSIFWEKSQSYIVVLLSGIIYYMPTYLYISVLQLLINETYKIKHVFEHYIKLIVLAYQYNHLQQFFKGHWSFFF